MKPTTWLLWLGPFALVLVGAWTLLRYLRRRNQTIAGVVLSDEESKRAAALLQEGEK